MFQLSFPAPGAWRSRLREGAIALVGSLSLILKLYYTHFQLGMGDTARLEILGSLALFSLACACLLGCVMPRLPAWLRLAGHAALAFWLQIDLLFYRYFGNLPSSAYLEQAGNLGSVRSSVGSLLHTGDLLLFVDLPLLAWLAFRGRQRFAPRRRSFLLGLAACAALLALRYPGDPPFGFALRLSPYPDLTLKYGVLHYQASQLLHDALAPSAPADPQAERRLALMLADRRVRPDELSGRYRGKNLLVIQVESLQGFVIGRSVNGQAITPHLNRLLRQSLYFPNFYHQTGAGHTADAEFLTQNALYGEEKGVAYLDLKARHLRALPAVLNQAGYRTFSMHGNGGGFYNRAVMHPRLGFQHTYFEDALDARDGLGWGISDKSFLRQALSKTRAGASPYYGFLITLSSHHPFEWRYPAAHPLRLGALAPTLLGRYLAAIHYTDEALGEFIDGLARSGRLADTVVAIYGDHNAVPRENLGELLAFLHEPEHPYTWALQQRVPLLIRLPDQVGRVVPRVGGEVDLAPTLADLLGVPTPIFQAAGQSLLTPGAGRAVLRDGTWVDQAHVCQHNLVGGTPTVYDYQRDRPVPYARVRDEDAAAHRLLATSDLILANDLPAPLDAEAARLRAGALRLALHSPLDPPRTLVR